jgi:Uri superfamily endonuclease
MKTNLPDDLRSLLQPEHMWTCRDVAGIPDGGGAYLLIMELRRARKATWGRSGAATLAPGWYIYAGNAGGPGGMRARITRHFCKDKARHWHVDQLTAVTNTRAIALPGADECALIRQLISTGAFLTPLSGFGSSDCRVCGSHLLAFDKAFVD